MPIDVCQHVTDQIINALENGTVPWRNPILGSNRGGWPTNFVSGKPYRGSNVFLLAITAWAKGYAMPYWLTFRQAKLRGGSVRKGEKSTLVIFWKQLTVEDDETGKTKRVPMLRHYRVFNVEQCKDIDMREFEEPAMRSEFSPIEAADRVVSEYQDDQGGPDVVHDGSLARYVPVEDVVKLPPPERFRDDAAYYATLFHELVHSTGHSSRLDRELDTASAPFGSPDYSREELIAEMGAAFLCGHVGITPTTIDNAAAYIGGWLKRLQGDNRLVIQCGGAAQRAVDYMLGVTFDDESD